MVAGCQNTEELTMVIGRLKAQKRDKLTKYQRDLLDWYENVDQKYAWVILVALFLIMGGSLGCYRIYGYVYATVVEQGIFTREEASWPVSLIYTVENALGPLVSIIVYHISLRKSLLLGGILLTATNMLATISNNLAIDILLLGCIQGFGYAFLFMPLMEIINSYFLRYRNMALGFALCGGTFLIFPLAPIFQWILSVYPWRYAYLGIGMFSTIIILMVPLLRPNPQPKLQPFSPAMLDSAPNSPITGRSTLARLSFRALSYQNSIRRQSTTLSYRQADGMSNKGSVRSVNPFAASVGLERELARAIRDEKSAEAAGRRPSIASSLPRTDKQETTSVNEVANEGPELEMSMILDVLKTPAFHLIWYCELICAWLFTIYCLVLVDFGIDRGCTLPEAESLINYQSFGEIIGRLILTSLVDLHYLSNKNTMILVLLSITVTLVAITQTVGFVALASLTVAYNALIALLFILLNGLLVDYLGERKVTLGYGLASCISGVLMFFRPYAVGYFRDTHGSYEPLMLCLAASCALGAVMWLLEPLITRLVERRKPITDLSANGPITHLNA